MAIDGNNIILVGVEGQDLNQGNFLTLKYDLDGIFQWKANFGTPSNLNCEGNCCNGKQFYQWNKLYKNHKIQYFGF